MPPHRACGMTCAEWNRLTCLIPSQHLGKSLVRPSGTLISRVDGSYAGYISGDRRSVKTDQTGCGCEHDWLYAAEGHIFMAAGSCTWSRQCYGVLGKLGFEPALRCYDGKRAVLPCDETF